MPSGPLAVATETPAPDPAGADALDEDDAAAGAAAWLAVEVLPALPQAVSATVARTAAAHAPSLTLVKPAIIPSPSRLLSREPKDPG